MRLTALFLLLLSASAALAQTQPATAPATQPDLTTQLTTLFERVISDRNLDEAQSAIDPDCIAIMPTGERLSGFAGLKSYWADLWTQLGEKGELKVQVRPLGTPSIRNNIALLHGETDVILYYTATGRQVRATILWSCVLHHDGDVWKVIQMQGTIDPVNNQLQKIGVHSAIIIWSGLGLFIGIGVGIAGYRMLWRERIVEKP